MKTMKIVCGVFLVAFLSISPIPLIRSFIVPYRGVALKHRCSNRVNLHKTPTLSSSKPAHVLERPDASQLAAISSNNPAILLVSGAGTGKTRVLASRLARILRKNNIQDNMNNDIDDYHNDHSPLFKKPKLLTIVLSFNSQSANQICKQALQLPGGFQALNQSYVWHGTFHSFALKILSKYPFLGTGFNHIYIVDKYEQIKLMNKALKIIYVNNLNKQSSSFSQNQNQNQNSQIGKLAISSSPFSRVPTHQDLSHDSNAILNIIGIWKEKGLYPYDIIEQDTGKLMINIKNKLSTNCGKSKMNPLLSLEELASMVYPIYQKELNMIEKCDFGDLILSATKLIKTQPSILESIRSELGHVIVDEFQDVSPAQYELLRVIVTGMVRTTGLSNKYLQQENIHENSNQNTNQNTRNHELKADSSSSSSSSSSSFSSSSSSSSSSFDLIRKHQVHLTCAGDDDQSIYAWRGVDAINNIKKFEIDYEYGQIMLLKSTYRFLSSILGAASSFIMKNGHPKRLNKPLPHIGEGGPALKFKNEKLAYDMKLLLERQNQNQNQNQNSINSNRMDNGLTCIAHQTSAQEQEVVREPLDVFAANLQHKHGNLLHTNPFINNSSHQDSNHIESASNNNNNNVRKRRSLRSLWRDEVVVKGLQDSTQEAEFIARRILELKATPLKNLKIAVLVRSAWQTRELEESLLRLGLLYKLEGISSSFLMKSELKFPVILLQALVFSLDDKAVLSVASHACMSGIGENTISEVKAIARKRSISWEQAARVAISEEGILKTSRTLSSLKLLISKLDRWRYLLHFHELSESSSSSYGNNNDDFNRRRKRRSNNDIIGINSLINRKDREIGFNVDDRDDDRYINEDDDVGWEFSNSDQEHNNDDSSFSSLYKPSVSKVIKQILMESGYFDLMETKRKTRQPFTSSSLSSEMFLNEFAHLVGSFRSVSSFIKHFNKQRNIMSSLQSGSVSSNNNNSTNNPYKAVVNIMTIHKSKGREFSHVFVSGWEEGVFPYNINILQNYSNWLLNMIKQPQDGSTSTSSSHEMSLYEERRLAYVALTRATGGVLLTYAKKRKYNGKWLTTIPSQFLSELPSEHTVFSEPLDTSSISSSEKSEVKQPTVTPSSKSSSGSGLAALAKAFEVNKTHFMKNITTTSFPTRTTTVVTTTTTTTTTTMPLLPSLPLFMDPSQPVTVQQPSQSVTIQQPSQPVTVQQPSQPTIVTPQPSQPVTMHQPSQPVTTQDESKLKNLISRVKIELNDFTISHLKKRLSFYHCSISGTKNTLIHRIQNKHLKMIQKNKDKDDDEDDRDRDSSSSSIGYIGTLEELNINSYHTKISKLEIGSFHYQNFMRLHGFQSIKPNPIFYQSFNDLTIQGLYKIFTILNISTSSSSLKKINNKLSSQMLIYKLKQYFNSKKATLLMMNNNQKKNITSRIDNKINHMNNEKTLLSIPQLSRKKSNQIKDFSFISNKIINSKKYEMKTSTLNNNKVKKDNQKNQHFLMLVNKMIKKISKNMIKYQNNIKLDNNLVSNSLHNDEINMNKIKNINKNKSKKNNKSIKEYEDIKNFNMFETSLKMHEMKQELKRSNMKVGGKNKQEIALRLFAALLVADKK